MEATGSIFSLGYRVRVSQVPGVPGSAGYKIVKLIHGAYSVHSLAHRETFHPVIGPVAEAAALYVRQLGLVERIAAHKDQFVIWDVGLGAAANVLTVLRAVREVPASVHVVSFDHTLEPLKFALQHVEKLEYLGGYEGPLEELINRHQVLFATGSLHVRWEVHLADFPTLLAQAPATNLPKPYAIMFDAFSPATNPAMWTQPLFANLYRLLDPARPCALPTYSRSTMLRVTLLLAGFFVGIGHPTGEKEETTVAANARELLAEPLDRKWLQRARRSTSAEPMWKPIYRQAPLAAETWEKLMQHPQFL
jgi:tRNA U34 5-methylaminomethyl-2-thiouridine-forming methyltransferase MnmC